MRWGRGHGGASKRPGAARFLDLIEGSGKLYTGWWWGVAVGIVKESALEKATLAVLGGPADQLRGRVALAGPGREPWCGACREGVRPAPPPPPHLEGSPGLGPQLLPGGWLQRALPPACPCGVGAGPAERGRPQPGLQKVPILQPPGARPPPPASHPAPCPIVNSFQLLLGLFTDLQPGVNWALPGTKWL